MSGEVSTDRAQLQFGPRGYDHPDEPFTARQLARLDEALTLSSRESGLVFSVYVGELRPPARAHAEALFEKLSDDAVLVAVSPGQRCLHIVTGPESAKRLPNRSCALAALAMRASFANGDLLGGIVIGLRMLADAAGPS
ncbi:MAG: hypothetical protein QOG80_201 [Pseudonocardiales bacterium]|nr:hypothetical protein [Pseudonocardiales bacterium]